MGESTQVAVCDSTAERVAVAVPVAVAEAVALDVAVTVAPAARVSCRRARSSRRSCAPRISQVVPVREVLLGKEQPTVAANFNGHENAT